MRDRGTQLVLSIFVGAFVARPGCTPSGSRAPGRRRSCPGWPCRSLALAGLGVGVLIYFIHHLARSIQIDSIMKQVEREALSVIAEVYPGRQPSYREPEELCPEPPLEVVGLPSARSGYVQAVHPEPLVRAAVDHDLMIVLAQVGDHAVAGTPIAWAWSRSPGRPPPGVDAGVGRSPRASRSASSGRWSRTSASASAGWSTSPTALSPAINDPYTGVQAVHHPLGAGVPWPASAWATG